MPLEAILRVCAERGDFGPGPVSELVAERLMKLAVTKETFQERFEELDEWQVTLYLCNVLVAALTTILIVMPVSVHRRLFRRGLKATLVSNADLVTKLALGGVALLIVGSAALVFDVTIGRTAGLVTGGTIILIVLVIVVGMPFWILRRAVHNNNGNSPQE